MNKIVMINNKAGIEKFAWRFLRTATSSAFILGIVHIRVGKFLENITYVKCYCFLILDQLFIIYTPRNPSYIVSFFKAGTCYFIPYCFITPKDVLFYNYKLNRIHSQLYKSYVQKNTNNKRSQSCSLYWNCRHLK